MRVYQFRHVGIQNLFNARKQVPTEGLEPPHLAAHGPEPCASTNSATWAYKTSSMLASRCPRRDSNPHTSRHMDLNHARLPIPPRGHWTALLALLDVAVEFRYDIRLCCFALDQLSFVPSAHRLRSAFVSGWAVSEETESIADGWQMSKGLRAGRSLHASRPTLGESPRPPLHYACLRVNVTISAPSDRWMALTEKIR